MIKIWYTNNEGKDQQAEFDNITEYDRFMEECGQGIEIYRETIE